MTCCKRMRRRAASLARAASAGRTAAAGRIADLACLTSAHARSSAGPDPITFIPSSSIGGVRMTRHGLMVSLVFLVCSGAAAAQDFGGAGGAAGGAETSAANFVVGDIRIEGLQRISEGTVFNYLPVNIDRKS